MKLYNNGQPFDCDMTYSKGNFYGKFKLKKHNGETLEIEIPEPKYKFDVYPQTEDTIKIETLKPLPLENNSIESIVIDLPFVITPPTSPSMKEGKKGSNIISKRFACFYPHDQLFETYAFYLKEAYRVLKPNGLCVFKTQSNISGGINFATPYYSVMCATKIGLILEDEFILNAKNRLISGQIKTQQHSRKYHSQFLVFKKHTSKKYNKLNYFDWIEKYVNN